MDLPGSIDSYSKASTPIHSSCLQAAGPSLGSASHAGSCCWIWVQHKSRGRLEAEGSAEELSWAVQLSPTASASAPGAPAPLSPPSAPPPSSQETSLSQFCRLPGMIRAVPNSTRLPAMGARRWGAGPWGNTDPVGGTQILPGGKTGAPPAHPSPASLREPGPPRQTAASRAPHVRAAPARHGRDGHGTERAQLEPGSGLGQLQERQQGGGGTRRWVAAAHP